MDTPERIPKVLARMGVGSRRQIEAWITTGKCRHTNGKPVVLGEKCVAGDVLVLEGRNIKITAADSIARTVIMYNKPEGQLCTRRDPQGRSTIFETLPTPDAGRLIPVGRLDINTSGLLLLTNDGELANQLMHPKYEVPREYAVRVLGEVTPAMIEALTRGVQLEDGKACFSSLREGGAGGGGGTGSANRWFHVVLREGRKREVRRLWESQGVRVSRLIRTRYGCVKLPKDLPQGQYRDVPEAMIQRLLTPNPQKKRKK